jgi:hypothetical protein
MRPFLVEVIVVSSPFRVVSGTDDNSFEFIQNFFFDQLR